MMSTVEDSTQSHKKEHGITTTREWNKNKNNNNDDDDVDDDDDDEVDEEEEEEEEGKKSPVRIVDASPRKNTKSYVLPFTRNKATWRRPSRRNARATQDRERERERERA